MNININFASAIRARIKDIEALKARVAQKGLEEFRVKDIKPLDSERKHGWYRRYNITLSSGSFFMALVDSGILEVVRKEETETKVAIGSYNRPTKVYVNVANGDMVEETYELVEGETYTIKIIPAGEQVYHTFRNKINVYRFTDQALEDYKAIVIEDIKERFAKELGAI